MGFDLGLVGCNYASLIVITTVTCIKDTVKYCYPIVYNILSFEYCMYLNVKPMHSPDRPVLTQHG